jgi:ubiquinol-cytochrome c reductase cytochrome c1 subunit
VADLTNGENEAIASEGNVMIITKSVTNTLKSALLTIAGVVVSMQVWASGGHDVALQKANTDVLDTASLQRGADIYANYCMGCHSMKYMRVSRIGKDIGWTEEEALSKMQVLRHGQGKVHEPMMRTIDPALAAKAFGSAPPDLSLEARLRGTDWVYSFLKAYQRDEQGKVHNAVFSGVAMPFILEGMQRDLSPEGYDQAVRDLVNFMDYAAEPAKLKRLTIGWWALAFLALLFILTYLLKKEFWRDVKAMP